jgi:hypothetical protein
MTGGADAGRPRRGPKRIPWSVILVFAGGLVTSFFLIGYGVANTSERSSDVWFEVAKAGFQLFAVILVGGATAWAFRRLDDLREDRRRRDEYLATVASDLWTAYLGVKAVRRALRAAGFGRSGSEPIEDDQFEEFKRQMDLLADPRATFERLVADVETQPALYQPIAEPIGVQLGAAERYVAGVMKNWEYEGTKVKVGSRLDEDQDLQQLRLFLDHAYSKGGLKEKLSRPVENAALLIQALRFERHRELLEIAGRISESDRKASVRREGGQPDTPADASTGGDPSSREPS